MPTPISRLDPLLDEWHAMVQDDTAWLNRPHDVESEALTSGLFGQLQRGEVLTAAVAWWCDHERALEGRERLRHLDALLGALDLHFAGQPVQPVDEGGGGDLRLVGRRWWRRFAPEPRAPFSIQEPFPNLIRGVLGTDEWVAPPALHDAFSVALGDGPLRVGLCVLSGGTHTRFEGTHVLTGGVYGFRGVAVEPEVDAANELRDAVAWAVKRGVHVLAFPELAVDEAGRAVLVEAIRSSPGSLCLVVPGSFHVESDREAGERANGAPLWAVVSGVVVSVGTVEKTETLTTGVANLPGPLRDQATASGCTATREDVRPDGRIRVVRTPAGTLSVVICRDALVTGAVGPLGDVALRSYRAADHVVFVSMNGSPRAWFWERADEAARHHEAATYYVNAAQAVPAGQGPVDLAFWRLPYSPPGLQTEPVGLGSQPRFRRAQDASAGVDDQTVHALPPDGCVLLEVPVEASDWFAGGAR